MPWEQPFAKNRNSQLWTNPFWTIPSSTSSYGLLFLFSFMDKSIYTREYAVFLQMLRSARETRRITQMELAEALSTTQTFVSKAERGERRLDVVELRQWCLALNIEFDHFARQLTQAYRHDSR